MSRTLLVALAILLPLAGCIAPPEGETTAALDDPATPSALPPPPASRVDGMTAEETKEDKVEPCADGGVSIPLRTHCAERTLVAKGRIGLDALEVDLDGVNGPIALVAGPGDAWSFTAWIKVSGASEQEARDGLDTAWAWSHADGDRHFLKAGSTGGTSLVGPQLMATRYEVTLPAWLLLNVVASTSNGAISVTGVQAGSLALDTSNGPVTVAALADDVTLDTSNGAIDAVLTPMKSGRYTLDTSNGAIRLVVPETLDRGYDLAADTSNGRIDIGLRDGEVTQADPDEATFTTRGFDARPVQTVVELDTSNGRITVAPA